MTFRLIFVMFVALLSPSVAYPSGAHSNVTNPMESFSSYCTSGNFRPNHGNHLPQSSPAPYTITVNAPGGNIYRPGQQVTITLEGQKAPNATTFKGFFIQGDSTESFAGEIACGAQGKKVSFCGKSGATHVNAEVKDIVKCFWDPPDYQIGRVQFVATFVSNFSTFWTGVRSSTTLLADPSTMTFAVKSQRMREQMMRQFQQGGFQTILNQGGHQLSQLFGRAMQGGASSLSNILG